MTYKSVLEGLKNVYERATKLGDDILTIVEDEEDPEIKAMITELSNQCYSLAMDAKDNAETYKDMMEEEDEEEDVGDFEEIPNEEEEEPASEETSEETPSEEELEPMEDEEA